MPVAHEEDEHESMTDIKDKDEVKEGHKYGMERWSPDYLTEIFVIRITC